MKLLEMIKHKFQSLGKCYGEEGLQLEDITDDDIHRATKIDFLRARPDCKNMTVECTEELDSVVSEATNSVKKGYKRGKSVMNAQSVMWD